MSKASGYFRTGKAILDQLAGEKPHSSITDWVEVLSSDRYDELSLDGIPELVDSINLQGQQGVTEASRAIRKKLKYGNVHRQLRALVILRALTENAGKGFQNNWANAQLLERLEAMAQDSLVDPKVKKRLILVFHAWSLHYADEPRMSHVANLYKNYAGGARRAPTTTATRDTSSASQDASNTSPTTANTFDDPFFDHSWDVAPGQRGANTYVDPTMAKADAEERKRDREARIALEHREAEIERRERDLKRKSEMANVEARRKREAEEEQERRRKAKEQRKLQSQQPKRPKFNYVKEKPQVMVAVANALQSSNALINSCRLINREVENVTESPRVQDNLDKAKAARRQIIRYIQLVTDEDMLGTLINANEKIVESIQLYDKLSKPAALDSDSEHEKDPHAAEDAEQVERIRQRLAAQTLEGQRTGEVEALQEAQRAESKKAARAKGKSVAASGTSGGAFADLQDLDFGSISNSRNAGAGSSALPPPMRPDSDAGSYEGRSLSDFSDYDSSEDEWQAKHSRQSSRQYDYDYTRKHQSRPSGSGAGVGGGGSNAHPDPAAYASLDDEAGARGLLDPNDPFGDPFGDDNALTPGAEKPRMEWAAI